VEFGVASLANIGRAREIVAYHHERCDGRDTRLASLPAAIICGRGLTGGQISIFYGHRGAVGTLTSYWIPTSRMPKQTAAPTRGKSGATRDLIFHPV
jgi:hypothetical protein